MKFSARTRTYWLALLCTTATLSLSACSGDAAPASSTSSTVGMQTGTINRDTTPPQVVAGNPGNPGTPSTPVGVPVTPPTSTPASSGTATLDWTPPTQNSDGSALTNLAGYHLYYGTSASNLSQSVQVGNAGLSAYTVSNLSPGTWYFAVTSYSSSGVESARSATVSVTL